MKRPPGSHGHLSRLLDAWARQPDERVTAGRLRHLVGVTAIIEMLDGLSDDEGRPRIAFKGGAALQLRFGFRARASNDLDAIFRGQISEATRLISDAVSAGWSGFTGTTTEGEPIEGTGLPVPPIRFRVRLRYKGKDFVTIPMELSPAEGRSLDEVEVFRAAVSLDPVQLTDAEAIPFLPTRYQVAQKLHACTKDLGKERPNQRARDLVDLLIIEELAVADDQLPSIRAACVETFALRDTHPWPPTISAWPGWDDIWMNLKDAEQLSDSLAESIDRVQALVTRIDAAR